MTRMPASNIRTCTGCGVNFAGKGKCPVCNPLSPRAARPVRTSDRVREHGLYRSEKLRRDLLWDASVPPRLLWHIRFSVVFSPKAHSKNASHVVIPGGKYKRVTTKVAQDAKSEIADKAKRMMQEHGIAIVQSKLWIDILVQKNSWSADAVNVIDTVMDGLKLGVGLDDRWFGIRILDFEMVKGEQRLLIGFGQETGVDHDYCITCGSLLPIFDLRGVTGIERVCDPCAAAI